MRGYLAGSAWEEYQRSGSICGIALPKGLRESEELPQPIFTPTTKAEVGHDVPITFRDLVELAGHRAANAIRLRSLALYNYAREYARNKGIIIADTKFEFGWIKDEHGDDEVTLIDECLTPDSSRLWPTEGYQPGRPQPSFDKQFVRDYLTEIGWDRESDPPSLPDEVVQKTAEKYRDTFRRLTGQDLHRPQAS